MNNEYDIENFALIENNLLVFLQIYQHELIFPFFGIMITTNGEQACKTEIAQIRLSRNAQNAMRFKKQIITPNKKANINLSILFHPFI